VLSLDEASGRLAVELELAHKGESHGIKAKEANVRALPARQRTAAALQELVDLAEDGSRVSIPSGRFVGAGPLEIRGAITLEGQGATASVLAFPVYCRGGSGALLRLASFGVDGASLEVGGAAIQRAHLSKVHVSFKQHNGNDALTLNRIGSGYAADSILLDDCDVRGGGDGVMINADGVRLLRCRILNAASRGIFANPDFVIEDSTVQGCGSYGMKTRGGVERRGRNNIQAGPWDEHQGYGAMFGAGMGGMPGMGGKSSMFNASFGGGEYGDGDETGSDGDEMGGFGFTRREEEELLSQGVKPWEDDAHAVLAAQRDDDQGGGFRWERGSGGGTDSEEDGSYDDDEEEDEGDEEDEEDGLMDILDQALVLGLITMDEEEMLWNAVDNGETTEEELLAKWKPQVYAAASTPTDDDDDCEPRAVEVEEASSSHCPAPSASSSGAWPPELQLWVERSFGQCKNERERSRCEKDLKERISAFKGNCSGHALAPPSPRHCPSSLCCWRTPVIQRNAHVEHCVMHAMYHVTPRLWAIDWKTEPLAGKPR
jgi:hypothetical protein